MLLDHHVRYSYFKGYPLLQKAEFNENYEIKYGLKEARINLYTSLMLVINLSLWSDSSVRK